MFRRGLSSLSQKRQRLRPVPLLSAPYLLAPYVYFFSAMLITMKPETRKRRTPKRNILRAKSDGSSDEVHELAQQTERQLNTIQRSMRQRLQAEFARGSLTGPQRLVMSALVRTQGLSLKELSHRVSLAHSTVSGIVDRLAKRGFI